MFTVALLRDTGFYQDINENFANSIYWGRNRGCDFFTNACKGVYTYPEFVKDNTIKSCSYENEGFGVGVNSVTLDGCFYTMTYSNKLCINEENNALTTNKYVNDRYENFST